MAVLGILCIIGAVIGRFWAILYIGGRKNMVVMQDGLCSICRQPLYLFSTLAAVGFGLTLGSVIVTAVVRNLAFAILSMTAAREERYLRQTFAG